MGESPAGSAMLTEVDGADVGDFEEEPALPQAADEKITKAVPAAAYVRILIDIFTAVPYPSA